MRMTIAGEWAPLYIAGTILLRHSAVWHSGLIFSWSELISRSDEVHEDLVRQPQWQRILNKNNPAIQFSELVHADVFPLNSISLYQFCKYDRINTYVPSKSEYLMQIIQVSLQPPTLPNKLLPFYFFPHLPFSPLPFCLFLPNIFLPSKHLLTLCKSAFPSQCFSPVKENKRQWSH